MPMLVHILVVFTVICHAVLSSFDSSESKPHSSAYRRVIVKPKHYVLRTRAPDNEPISEETAAFRALLRQQRVKRKKFAILLAYDGRGYCGFQRNPNVKTIEEDLFTALLKARYITEEMWNQSQLVKFDLASRTDKGVSALGQVVSLKLPVNATGEAINEYLPMTIRVLDLVRVAQGFRSRLFSSSRTYSYTLPTQALLPPSAGSGLLAGIEDVLQKFVGHHSYHNFTPKKSEDFSTYFRTITNFSCGKPFFIDGTEFVSVTVTGRSFLMHQIRKMVALSIAILHEVTDPATLSRALDHTLSVSIPPAPGTGLVLEKVLYKRYNARYGNDGIHNCLEWKDQQEKVERFREEFIYPSLVQAEKNESYPFKIWEFTVNH